VWIGIVQIPALPLLDVRGHAVGGSARGLMSALGQKQTSAPGGDKSGVDLEADIDAEPGSREPNLRSIRSLGELNLCRVKLMHEFGTV
jgi:hypothetical protein